MAKDKHLTDSERLQIEQLLWEGISLKRIAADLDKSASTISREIRAHAIESNKYAPYRIHNRCAKLNICQKMQICADKPNCTKKCSHCNYCNAVCEEFEERVCIRLYDPPYVKYRQSINTDNFSVVWYNKGNGGDCRHFFVCGQQRPAYKEECKMNVHNLAKGVLRELEDRGYAESTLNGYSRIFERIVRWFDSNNDSELTQLAVENYLDELEHRLQSGAIGKLYHNQLRCAAKRLNEYEEDENVSIVSSPTKREFQPSTESIIVIENVLSAMELKEDFKRKLHRG